MTFRGYSRCQQPVMLLPFHVNMEHDTFFYFGLVFLCIGIASQNRCRLFIGCSCRSHFCAVPLHTVLLPKVSVSDYHLPSHPPPGEASGVKLVTKVEDYEGSAGANRPKLGGGRIPLTAKNTGSPAELLSLLILSQTELVVEL